MPAQFDSRSSLSEINVTPLVDVMLVLLVIFMITVPVIQTGIQVDVPQTRGAQALSQTLHVITVNRAGNVFLDGQMVPFKALAAAVRSELLKSSQRDIYIQADEGLPWGTLARVTEEVNRAGVGKVNFVTQPYDHDPPAPAH